jgi:hypothetical protein
MPNVVGSRVVWELYIVAGGYSEHHAASYFLMMAF